MIEDQPSQYQHQIYKLGEWGVGDQHHIPVCTIVATRVLISDWKATTNYIYYVSRIIACACSHFHKLPPPAVVYNQSLMDDETPISAEDSLFKHLELSKEP